MGWMPFWWIFILLIIVVGVWYAASATKQGGLKSETAGDILKRRYASGEIDRETYERMLADLQK